MNRPWLAHYDYWVPPSLTYPERPLWEILDSAYVEIPDKPATAFLGATLTYRDIKVRSEWFASSIGKLGIGKGDRVGIMLPNCPQYVIAAFAVLRHGAIVVNINPTYTPRELLTVEVQSKGEKTTGEREFVYVGTNRLQQQADAPFEQTHPPHRVLRIHDGLGVEYVGVEPGEVTRVIGRGVRCAGDQESLCHRKGAVHRVSVKVFDGRQRMMRLSQETITEEVDRLKGIGDKGRSDTLVKPISAM